MLECESPTLRGVIDDYNSIPVAIRTGGTSIFGRSNQTMTHPTRELQNPEMLGPHFITAHNSER